MMKTDMDTVLEAFRLHEPREEPAAAWLAQALSDRGELCVEVTFDMAAQDPATFLYVDLVNTTGERRAHLSIRVAARCVILNMLEHGVWKEAVAASIDFATLRHWRLWLVVDQAGSFSVRLGHVTLCTYQANFLPADVARIASNVSARLALGPTTPVNGPCGVLDREAPLGSTALIHAPQVPDATHLKLFLGGGAVEILETTPLTLAGQRWFACLLDERLILQHPRSQFLRMVVPGGPGPGSAAVECEIFDVRAHPVVEIGAADVALRSAGQEPPEEVFWRCPQTGPQTAVRLVTVSRKAGWRDFVRFVTPLSELLRLVPPGAGRSLAVLEAPDLPVRLYQLAVSEQLYTTLEAFVRRTEAADLPVSAEWRMIFLDWWSVLHLPEHAARVARLAPDLAKFLDEQRPFVGHFIAAGASPTAPEAAPPEAVPPDEAPGAEAIPLRRALRRLGVLFADPGTRPDALRREVLTLSGLLRAPERHVFLLEIAVHLADRGLGDILNAELPDPALAELLVPDSPAWRLSSALVPLAARNRFGDCAGVLERLAKLQGDAVNCGAIAAAIRAASARTLANPLKYRMSNAFMAFLKALGSRDYSPFRHVGLIRALIRMVFAAAGEPDWHQATLLAFVEEHYATVPEFWTEFAALRQEAPGGLFLDRLDNIAATAGRANAGLQSFRAFDERGAFDETGTPDGVQTPDGIREREPARVQVLAAGERQDHLTTFLRLHGLSGPVHWGSGPSAALCEDHFLRSCAHPFLNRAESGGEAQTSRADLLRLPLRDAILRLQTFPRLDHRGLLESVGRALLAGDDDRLCSFIPTRTEAGPTTDAATNAVILDAVAWVLLTRRHDEILLGSVIVQIIDHLKAAPDRASVPPALHMAIHRLLQAAAANPKTANPKAGTLEALTLRQIAVLHRLYLDRFPKAWIGQGGLSASFFSDTLVALVTCRKYLDTRARECRETWVRDLEAAGVTVLFFCGSDDVHAEPTLDPETSVVRLPVGDAYEDLPAKSLEIFRWIRRHRPESFVLKIDDDCYLDAQNFLESLAYRRSHYFGRPLTAFAATFNRTWHQSKSARSVNQRAIDTSPLDTRYADGGGSYGLSRFALDTLERVAATGVGLRLRMASFFEDKMVGDLLREGGIAVSDAGYTSLQARRTHGGAQPVLQIDRTFFPGATSGIAVAHLDATGRMAGIRASRDSLRLEPARLWPMTVKPSLRHDANMLEYLTAGGTAAGGTAAGARARIAGAEVVCVAALRNEATLLPHMLQHYRGLGVDLFLMVDNLSDDGTREYLADQPDVLLFSAANDYRDSHYAVDWQRVLLDHFCPGRWVVVADADEFLLLPEAGPGALKRYCARLEAAGHDAALVLMADMYPEGALEEADFSHVAPGRIACGHDRVPVRRWMFNQGPFGNLGSYVSGLRHRLMPLSSPERFTAQKVALFRFNPLMAFSEGFHFGAGLTLAPEPLAFLHYKYSAEFAAKARLESRRQQHFGGGVEYRAYLKLVEAGLTSLWQDGVSQTLDPTAPGALARLLEGVEPPFVV